MTLCGKMGLWAKGNKIKFVRFGAAGLGWPHKVMLANTFWATIYWFSLPILAMLAAILVRRKAFTDFPLFSWYIVLSCVVTLARFFAHSGTNRTYFYTYWISEVALTVGALMASYELFGRRLFPNFHKVRLYRILFLISAVVIITLTVLTAIESIRIALVFIKITHAFDFLRAAVLFFFGALMLVMGRRWTRYELGIASGFALDTAVFLATFAMWTLRGRTVPKVVNELPVIAFDIASIIWLITFLKSEKPELVPTVPVSPEVLKEARKWEEALKGSLGKKKGSD